MSDAMRKAAEAGALRYESQADWLEDMAERHKFAGRWGAVERARARAAEFRGKADAIRAKLEAV